MEVLNPHSQLLVAQAGAAYYRDVDCVWDSTTDLLFTVLTFLERMDKPYQMATHVLLDKEITCSQTN